MKRSPVPRIALTLLSLAVILAGCTTAASMHPSPVPQAHSAEVTAQNGERTSVPGVDVPTDLPPDIAAVTNDANAISTNPLVRWLTDEKTQADADRAIQINNFASNDDKIGRACATFFRSPDTLRKASELASVSRLADEAKSVVVVTPIPPVGVMSTIAEIRRVERDITSGALQGRVAGLRTRVLAEKLKLEGLVEDAKLACAALVLDMLNAPARVAIRAAPLIVRLQQALALPGLKAVLP
jgi:hypothetical protein